MKKEGERFKLSYDKDAIDKNFEILEKLFISDMKKDVLKPRKVRPNETPLM
jgi:hypothetical protein